MKNETAEELRSKRCAACEGLGKPFSVDEARGRLEALPGWALFGNGREIRKDWQAKDFSAAMDFVDRVAELAEDEGHHPDLHLTSYRHVSIALSTHAIGGLSENDFILAAKIDALPIELRHGTR